MERKLSIIAALVILVLSNVVCYYCGYTYSYYTHSSKYYEDACRMSDLIRSYNDCLAEDTLINDYGCFDELEGIFLYDDAIGNPVNLDEYSWCY